jgi:hypothetical protein
MAESKPKVQGHLSAGLLAMGQSNRTVWHFITSIFRLGNGTVIKDLFAKKGSSSKRLIHSIRI